MGRGLGRQLVVGVALALCCAGCASPPAEPAPAERPSIRLLDLDGNEVDPLPLDGTRVFLFARTDCPISNRYAPEIRKLYERFSARGVSFRLVYLDRDQSVDEIRTHIDEYGYPFEALIDPSHLLVQHTGATVTPEAAVFRDGRMLYRGRIDDRYVDFGKARSAPTVHDLDDALVAVLDGRPVAQATTPAVGCFIPDLQ
jgi:hypothetical protein